MTLRALGRAGAVPHADHGLQAAHCLNDLLFRYRTGALQIEIPAIVSNHRDAEPLAATLRHPVPPHPGDRRTPRPTPRPQLLALVDELGVDLVVLARYMQVLSDELCRTLSGRAINIHHSFLPSFKGAKPYHQAHDRGVKLIGATAHYVTGDLDEGPIIEQDVMRVDHGYDRGPAGRRRPRRRGPGALPRRALALPSRGCCSTAPGPSSSAEPATARRADTRPMTHARTASPLLVVPLLLAGCGERRPWSSADPAGTPYDGPMSVRRRRAARPRRARLGSALDAGAPPAVAATTSTVASRPCRTLPQEALSNWLGEEGIDAAARRLPHRAGRRRACAALVATWHDADQDRGRRPRRHHRLRRRHRLGRASRWASLRPVRARPDVAASLGFHALDGSRDGRAGADHPT